MAEGLNEKVGGSFEIIFFLGYVGTNLLKGFEKSYS